MFQPDFYPTPNVFEIGNDAVPVTGQTTAPGRVILCYLPNAVATYCGQILDMTQWDAGFVDAMIERIARGLAPALARAGQVGLENEKLEAAAAAASAGTALMRQG
jgi:hypothetical protein